ncbi:hypothetical protein [Amycolatopsis sp. cmx-11-12]|uniref:hypothetical protein n=1 Tax=Amycolatopsis sp. cmx-11-12 TaxID=2785795 RepID=UPI003918400C
MRIIGSLFGLFGLTIRRIVDLAADRFGRADGDAFLTIGDHPVLLPPKLAVLIEQQLASPGLPVDGVPTRG